MQAQPILPSWLPGMQFEADIEVVSIIFLWPEWKILVAYLAWLIQKMGGWYSTEVEDENTCFSFVRCDRCGPGIIKL